MAEARGELLFGPTPARILTALPVALVVYGVLGAVPSIPGVMLTALLIASSPFANVRHVEPGLWWVWIGVMVGGLMAAADKLQPLARALPLSQASQARFVAVGFLVLCGIFLGAFLGTVDGKRSLPTPTEFLKAVATLTSAVFGTVVSYYFVVHGLEEARALASRLSTSATIIVSSVAVPGWAAHYCRERIRLLGSPERSKPAA